MIVPRWDLGYDNRVNQSHNYGVKYMFSRDDYGHNQANNCTGPLFNVWIVNFSIEKPDNHTQK